MSKEIAVFSSGRGLHPPGTSLISSTVDGRVEGLSKEAEGDTVAKLVKSTCADCYFRRAGLCALPNDVPCPTFRAYARGALAPSQQAPLVARPVPRFTTQHAAA